MYKPWLQEFPEGVDYYDSCEPYGLRKLRIAQQQQQAALKQQQQEDTSAHIYTQPSSTTGRELHVGRLLWKPGAPAYFAVREGEKEDESTSDLKTVFVRHVQVAEEFRGRRCGALLFNLLARRLHHFDFGDDAVVALEATDFSKDGVWHLVRWYESLSFELMQPSMDIMRDMEELQRLIGLARHESVKEMLRQTRRDVFSHYKACVSAASHHSGRTAKKDRPACAGINAPRA
eukprot:jgi/Chlat1/9101/Chrsp97S08379